MKVIILDTVTGELSTDEAKDFYGTHSYTSILSNTVIWLTGQHKIAHLMWTRERNKIEFAKLKKESDKIINQKLEAESVRHEYNLKCNNLILLNNEKLERDLLRSK